MFIKNPRLRYGILAGAAMVLVFSLWLMLFKDPKFYRIGEVVGYTTMILSLLAVYFGIRHERERLGGIGFRRGLGVGLQIALVAGVMFGIFTFALYEWVDPEFAERYQEQYIEHIQNSGASQERIDAELAKMESMKELLQSSLFQALLMFVTVFGLGLVIALFSALILRSRGAAPGEGSVASA